MFFLIPAEKEKLSLGKKSTKASRAFTNSPESKQAGMEAIPESSQQSFDASSVRADEVDFIYMGIRSIGDDVTLSIRIRNNSTAVKSVALYDSYVSWPKSKLTDQMGNSHDVTGVNFAKGSQKITSQAAGTQGLSINPHETIGASLLFKKAGKGIKSITLHPFIYQGRSWKEHDLPLKIGR